MANMPPLPPAAAATAAAAPGEQAPTGAAAEQLPPMTAADKDGSTPGAAPSDGKPPGAPLHVVLRVEVASMAAARVLTWSVLLLEALFILVAVGLVSLREADLLAVQLRSYYWALLGVGIACLAVELAMLGWLAASVRRCRREKRLWSVRQRFFTHTAATLLGLQTCYTAAWTISFAIVLAQSDCRYPWRVLTVFDFLQSFFFVSALMFMLTRIHSMTQWRGKGALDMHPDYPLTMDRPLRDASRSSRLILAAWALLACLGLARMIETLVLKDSLGRVAFRGDCSTPVSEWTCEPTATQIAAAAVSLVSLLLYIFFWMLFLVRALRDQAALPYNRVKSTLIFTRVQQRVLVPVFISITISVVLLTLLPVLASSTCWGLVDSQLGNLSVYLSMTVAAAVLAALYSPKSAVESPLLQELLQDFCWTRADIPAAIERRCQQLLAAEGPAAADAPPANGAEDGAAAAPATSSAHAQLAGTSFTRLAQGLARLVGVQDVASAAAQLRQERLFCVETAIKLFYWSRLAYREEDALEHSFVNAQSALPLFGLRHFETIWDEGTDTHAVLGWSDSQVVVAFRGTQTLQNIITDAKSWRARIPGRYRFGRPLLVHAGFLDAWHHSGFHRKVLDRLQELDSGPTPLRFWLTGHSLGGALAVLAAVDIRREHPGSELVLYAFGCPRVGNSAFAAEFDEAVPDAWMITNGLDPVPWVPKIGYSTAGKSATVNSKGDLIVRPSVFEMSVTHRGNALSHHMTGSYALSLAAVCKAQFAPSKALPGGPEGVAALAQAVDIGRALVLTHADLASLKDPELLPVSAEEAAAQQAQRAASLARTNSHWAAGFCGCAGPRRGGGDGTGGGGGHPAPCEGVAPQPAAAAPQAGNPASAEKRRKQRLQRRQRQVLHLDPPLPGGGGQAAAGATAVPLPSSPREEVHLTHYPTVLLGLDLDSSGSTGAGGGNAGSSKAGSEAQPTAGSSA